MPDPLLPDGNVDPRAVERRYRRIVGAVAVTSVAVFAPSLPIGGVPPSQWLPFLAAVALTALIVAVSLLAVPANTRASLVGATATAIATFALDQFIGGYYHQAPVLYALLVAAFAIIQGVGAAVVMVALGAILMPLASRAHEGLNPVDNLYAFVYLFAVAAVVLTRARLQERGEEAIRRSRSEYRELVERVPAVVYKKDPGESGRWHYASPRVVDLLGHTAEELMSDPGLWSSLLHPDDRDRVLAVEAESSLASDARPTNVEYRGIARDGLVRWMHDEAVRVVPEDGAPAHWSGVLLDITERKGLEIQVRQAQRMEAVGHFAGGIAHDFNNLLTAIHGYGELVRADLAEDRRVGRDLDEMLKAAERASELTGQLLAFSRQKAFQPKILAPAEVIEGLVPMLRRLLGTHIDLVTRHAAETGCVAVDQGELEQVIVNLVVNARDAMPDGGRLTIETRNVTTDPLDSAGTPGAASGEPTGHCVRITVNDTGVGIDASTQALIFEPFFTTKGAGKGTGIGLTTVYGIVRRSEGRITVTSATDRGTTFTIDLPRVATETRDRATTVVEPTPRGRETVLLVEDDAAVRAIARRVLVGLGYTVLEAASGADALEIAGPDGAGIELLLTDVQMPQMQGTELARYLRTVRPDLPVLLMSAYPGDEDGGSVNGWAGFPLLPKPFNARTLGSAVRAALDGRRA